MIVCTHTAIKKPRKSLEEWKDVITLPQFGGEFALMAPQSSIFDFRRFSSIIPLQLTTPGQLSSGCKRAFQISSLPRIGHQGSPDLNPLDDRLWSEL
ncbi:unnamed protein product [Nezara viridula]|uniref:Uncharacterized protein n=1 Tax=Nezara viridula TaxID=85310 RepID=A0A9P0E9E2_NEZVI|nr:unnamed protein product [Nezara viridula]